MQEAEQKQIRQMAQLISLSISPLRFVRDYTRRILWKLNELQGTGRRSQHQLELEIENMGGHLNAYTSV
jgi:hypothetical protein